MAAPTTPPRHISALDVPLSVLEAQIAEQRHQVDSPALEGRFAHLAIDHPDRCTHDDNWQPGVDRPGERPTGNPTHPRNNPEVT